MDILKVTIKVDQVAFIFWMCGPLEVKRHCKPYMHFKSQSLNFHIVLDFKCLKLNQENVTPIIYFLLHFNFFQNS